MSNSDYHVRAYVEGDETSLLSLFNQYYGRYAGFVPRTLQHWLWCCKLHPDIGSEGIFVACKGKEIVGYAVVGMLSRKEGGFIVYELCYDPAHDGEVIVSRLLERINQHVEEKKGNYITFPAPTDDTLVRQVCDTLGFKQNPLNEVIGYIILDMAKLIEHIIQGKGDEWKGRNGTFFIRLKDAPLPQKVISIQWIEDKPSVSYRAISDEPRVVIDTDLPTLNKLIFGEESVLKAMLKSKLVIKPLWKIRKGVRLLSLLSLRDRWYIPRLDQI
jgi:hypothetical protein